MKIALKVINEEKFQNNQTINITFLSQCECVNISTNASLLNLFNVFTYFTLSMNNAV